MALFVFVKVAEPVPLKSTTPGAGVAITNIDACSGVLDACCAFAFAPNREVTARALASMKERFIISPNLAKRKIKAFLKSKAFLKTVPREAEKT